MEEKYLVMVNPDYNNNKFYQMIPINDSSWKAVYGRIGQDSGANVPKEKIYPAYMFWIKYQEKIKKGYMDQSKIHRDSGKKVVYKKSYKPIPEKIVNNLMERLMQWSEQCIKENYTIEVKDVTEEMIREGRILLSTLSAIKEKDVFNSVLIELFHVIPRKMEIVNNYIACSEKDFDKILQRELQLLDIMETQVLHQKNLTVSNSLSEQTVLEKFGLEVHEATDKQFHEVLRHLNNGMHCKVKKVYHVVNKRTQSSFDAYLAVNNRPKVKLLWHGSKNENWFSILEKGLLLKPNAAITGKMFGNGIYFAPSARKSWNYTSSKDAIYNNCSSSTAIMALYATAFGDPADIYSRDKSYAGYGEREFQREHPNKNCLFAHGGTGMLVNDEIIFYREDQTTIKYLVEFAA